MVLDLGFSWLSLCHHGGTSGVTGVDERLLDSDEWVQPVLNDYDAIDLYRDLNEVVHDACQKHDVTETILTSRSRSRRHSRIRAEIALGATKNGCVSVTEVAKRFGRAHSGLSRAMNRLKDENQ